MNEQADTMEFNLAVALHNFLTAAKRLVWFALALALAVGGFTYYRQSSSYVPVYSSSAIFSVHASYNSTVDILSSSTFMDMSASKTLAATFPYVISSENTQMLLQNELGRPVTESIRATSTADSALFTMTVTDTNPQATFDVLLAAIAIYPQAASGILGDTQINIINLPTAPPTEPINASHPLRSAVTYGLIALLLGLGAIFLLSLTRKTVHSAEDLHKLVNLKCLAYIPNVKMKKHSDKKNLNILITNPRITSAFSESVRNLRIKLQKALGGASNKVLLVTSTLPNEGKTTVATNLALSLASEGKRVILIDGDLRKQSLKHTLGIDRPSDGLVEILTGTSKDFRLINVPDSTLLLLSGDEVSDHPQPLLDMPRMKQMIDLLRSKLDYIIIDTPPAGILSDAATIAKYADATIYVVRQDMANTTQILDSIQNLSGSGANLIGCVLNQTLAGTTRTGYGSKYHSAYGYSYGYKYSNSYAYGYRSRYAREDADALSDELNDTGGRRDT